MGQQIMYEVTYNYNNKLFKILGNCKTLNKTILQYYCTTLQETSLRVEIDGENLDQKTLAQGLHIVVSWVRIAVECTMKYLGLMLDSLDPCFFT